MPKPKVIAFYLPQFHPTPDNNKWWGKGFTEWTNVGKAKPLFKGHHQPKVPLDLGYYDLRLPEVREAQAELAKEAGIYGFCYYHYWFGNGKEELELPFNEVLKLGKPDFPFMLCWANESWHKKFWDKDANGSVKELLVEQTYPGEQDHIDHFYRLLPAFKDKRYIKEDEKLLFMIYKPFDFPNISEFIKLWNSLAIKEGLNGISFIAHLQDNNTTSTFIELQKLGFSYINTNRLIEISKLPKTFFQKSLNKLRRIIFKEPYIIRNYKKIYKNIINQADKNPIVFPTIIPNWDHTPRSGMNGRVFINSTPILFYKHCKQMLSFYKEKKIFFLKSWNEWGEGNYMEPDILNGKGYIESLNKALSDL